MMSIGDALVALNDRYANRLDTPQRREQLESEVKAMLVGDDPRVVVIVTSGLARDVNIHFRLKDSVLQGLKVKS